MAGEPESGDPVSAEDAKGLRPISSIWSRKRGDFLCGAKGCSNQAVGPDHLAGYHFCGQHWHTLNEHEVLREGNWYSCPNEDYEAFRLTGGEPGVCWEVWHKHGDQRLSFGSHEECDAMIRMMELLKARIPK